MMKSKKIIAYLTAFAIMAGAITVPTFTTASSAAKARLKSSKMTLNVGQKKAVKIKKKNTKAKYTFKSKNKSIASVSKKGLVTAKSEGRTKITVKEIYKKSTKKVGILKITVKSTPDNSSIQTPSDLGKNTTTDNNNSNGNNTATADTSDNKPVPTNPASETNDDNTVTTPAPEESAEPTSKPTPKPTTTPRVLSDTSTPQGFDSRKNGVAYGSMSTITYHSDTVGKDRKAVVLLPPNYSSSKKYPVLYLFHGGNGDENDWKAGNPAEILGNLIANGQAPEMILVMPNCRARANDSANPSDSLSHEHMNAWTKFLDDFQNDLMPYIAEHYSILTGRENTAVGGFSMGGREALYVGFSLPDKIGYIGAFSPAFGIFEYENWGLHENGYFKESEFKFPDEYMDDTVCLIMNGANDSMVRNEPERYHNALVSNKVNHFYYTMPGDHDWNVWKNGTYNYLKIVFK